MTANALTNFLPQVDTDGECLILRRIVINGEAHDIRVWRYDESGNSIAIDEKSAFLKETIRKTVELSQEIFSKHVVPGNKITYADQPTEGCFIASDPENYADVPLDSEAADLMRKIHHGFFRQEKTVWSKRGEDPFVTPVQVPKEAPPAVVSTPSSVEEMGDNASPTVSFSDSESDDPAADDDVSSIASSQAPDSPGPKEDFLEGIEYVDLRAYSHARKKEQQDDLEKVYQVYQNLLRKKPSEREEEEEALFQKLHVEYRNKWADLYEEQEMGARWMLGQILVDESIDGLVEELVKTPF